MKTPTKKTIRFEVKTQDGHSFSATNYSKYNDRLTAARNHKLRGRIFGHQQAEELVAELRRHIWDGKRPYAKSVFEIVRVTTVERVTKVLKTAAIKTEA